MKVITIKQPFASLIDNGLKEYDFRLENITKVSPIYVNGKLSLWDCDYKN